MLRDLIARGRTVDHPFMKPGNAGAPAGHRSDDRRQRPGRCVQFQRHPRGGNVRARPGRGSFLYRRDQSAQRDSPVGHRRSSELAAGRLLETRYRPRGGAPRDRRLQAEAPSREIVLVSSKLVTMMSQKPQTQKLVPIEAAAPPALAGAATRRPPPTAMRAERFAAPSSSRRHPSSCFRACCRNISSFRYIRRCWKPTPPSSPRSS